MVILISSVVTCLLFASLFVFVRAKNGACVDGIITKTLASFCFVMGGIFACVELPSFKIEYGMVLVGLICGMIGDIILELKVVYKENSGDYLTAGMLTFAIGHIAYITGISFISKNFNNPTLTAILIGLGVSVVLTALIVLISLKVLKLNFGSHLTLTIGYTFLLVFACVYTFILALSLHILIFMFLGLLLIFLSDMVLSQQYFGKKADSKAFHIINHSLYYLGQIAIVVFLFMFTILK